MPINKNHLDKLYEIQQLWKDNERQLSAQRELTQRRNEKLDWESLERTYALAISNIDLLIEDYLENN